MDSAECKDVLFLCLVLAALLAGVTLFQSASASSGCRDFKGRTHAEGARVDQSAISGIKSLTMVPVWYVCRGGLWVSATTGRPFGKR
jgi:hypothetical protein